MTPQPLTSADKPNRCHRCKAAFSTISALNQHRRSTDHLYFCAEPGCVKDYVSIAALEQHISSSSHTASSTATIHPSTVREDASVVSVGGETFPCTRTGCNKTFKTGKSRAQHMSMASHGKLAAVTMTQRNAKTVALPQQPTVTTAKAKQLNHSGSTEMGTSKSIHERQTTDTGTKIQPLQRFTQGKSTDTPKPPKPVKNSTRPSNRAPLFAWDTRWSAVPTARFAYVMAALRALVPTPGASSSSQVDKVYYTPDHKTAPGYEPAVFKRQAIVLDCEMVGIGPKGTTSELARLSAMDFLTGELLVDGFVQPVHTVTDWRTQWSGMTAESMGAAIASGEALDGSAAARAELFKHMNWQTVLVGHAIRYDLAALGIHHGIIVDSAVLAKAAVGKGVKREWGLKTLCKDLLGIVVQENGNNGHDSVEDTLAAREVVLWCLAHEAELKSWGEKKKKEHHWNKKQRKRRRQANTPMRAPQVVYYDDSDDDDFRCVSVEELNEMCGYPEWYDNWSD